MARLKHSQGLPKAGCRPNEGPTITQQSLNEGLTIAEDYIK
jgi:hypothetical protein